jgi:hypothetical protein
MGDVFNINRFSFQKIVSGIYNVLEHMSSM